MLALFAAILFVATKPAVTAQAQSSSFSYTLSEMSEENCIDFIIENSVDIPNEFIANPELGEFVKHIIQSAEANPECPIVFNNNVSYRFAEDIRAAVLDHYDLSILPSLSYTTPNSSPILTSSQQNEFFYWENGYEAFNCYAFAIERTEDPSEYSTAYQYQPGDFALTGSFWTVNTILELAEVVKDDLEFLGYNVSLHTQFTNPGANEKLIAIRWTPGRDFHFMKYNPNDEYWYHKPGWTSVLRFLGAQSNNDPWLHEGFYPNGEEFIDSYYNYTSDIYYIRYSTLPFEFNVTFDKQGGTGGDDGVLAVCDTSMPPASAPAKNLYKFDGYYSEPNGGGTQYYDENMDSVNNYNVIGYTTLYANWILTGGVTYSDYTVYNFYADSQNEGVIILDFRGQNVTGSQFIFHDLTSVKFIGDENDGWNDIQNNIQITVFNPYNDEKMFMHFENFRFKSFDYYAFYIFGDNIMITAEGDCLMEGADGFPALFIYARDITFYADIEEATLIIRGGNSGGGYPYISYLDEYFFNILFEGTGLFLETVGSSMSMPEGGEDFESFYRQIAEQIIADNIASGKWPPILENLFR